MNIRQPLARKTAGLLLLAIVAFSPARLPADELARTLAKPDPAAAGMDADKLAKIPARMREFVEAGQTAGAVTLVVRNGRVAQLSAVGQASIEDNLPMNGDTLFAIASMTKPITATAVMILAQEGKLSIEDPASKYVPSFKYAKLASGERPKTEVTIRHLMTHTSGLGGSQEGLKTLEQAAEALAARPLDFEPGTRWQYSPGLSVCGRIVEVVSGQKFEDFLADRIFRPLGMTDTTFYPTPTQAERLAQLYEPGKNGLKFAPAKHWLTDLTSERMPNPSGGLFSTAADLARFYQMILNGGELDGQRILSSAAVEQMTQLQTSELMTGFTPGSGWGLGWSIVRQPQGPTAANSSGTFGHGGAFGTQGWIDLQQKMILVLLVQRTGFGNSDGSTLRGEFQKLAAEAIVK